MITVNLPLKRKEVKEFIAGLTIEGHEYTFVKEEGIKLLYTDSNPDGSAGAAALKKALKDHLGPAFYFNVVWSENE